MKIVEITTEYITLGQLLKYLGIVSSGHEVKTYLQSKIILVNGENENRRGKKLYKDDVVKIDNALYKINI